VIPMEYYYHSLLLVSKSWKEVVEEILPHSKAQMILEQQNKNLKLFTRYDIYFRIMITRQNRNFYHACLVCRLIQDGTDIDVLLTVEEDIDLLIVFAIFKGDVGLFNQLINRRQVNKIPPSIYKYLTSVAIFSGDIKFLKYLVEDLKYPYNEETCHAAAYCGNLECLVYLHETVNCPWDEWTCHDSAFFGYYDCLQYSHQNGCPWNKETMKMAVMLGNLECVKYLHSEGCPWDTEVAQKASAYSSLECLKYLYDNGCPIDESSYKIAHDRGNIECIRYLEEVGMKPSNKSPEVV